MVDLEAHSAAAGLLPITHGSVTLRELTNVTLTSLMPFAGAEKAVSTALKKTQGVGLPDTGRLVAGKGGDIFWTGRNQYFVAGQPVGPLKASTTDQSDAWLRVALEGEEAADVLARLCPLDLGAMDEGDVARSLIGHMAAIIIVRSDGYDLMVFRAFAKTLVHDVQRAMKSVAAQAQN